MKQFLFLALAIASTAGSLYGDENIQTLGHNITFNVFQQSNANFLVDNTAYIYSMHPVKLGFSLKWKKLSFGFSVDAPFTYINEDFANAAAFAFEFHNYGEAVLFEGDIKYFSVFHNLTREDNSIALETFSAGLFFEYVLNNKNHSLGAVYAMDKLQKESSGSWLLGLNAVSTSIWSDNESDAYAYFGPNLGYSYTWILGNDYFVNAMLIAAPNLAIYNNNDGRDLSLASLLRPRVAIGRHFDTWSANCVIGNDSTLFLNKDALRFISLNMTVMLSKRF
jgi:hypothetical protein